MKKRMILTMAAAICCLVAGSLTAHAVFRYSAQTGGISIQMASFSVETQVQFVEAVTASTPSVAALALDVVSEGDGGLEELDVLDENGSYKFPRHGTATFTLTPTGSAGEGYVVVTIEGKGAYYTGQILKGNSYTFSITAEEGTMVKIEAVWGKYSADSTDGTANAEMQMIEQKTVIELITAEELNELTATPTVAPEATVEPTASPSPEATAEPTATPEISLEPTASPSPEVTLTVSPSPEPTATPIV